MHEEGECFMMVEKCMKPVEILLVEKDEKEALKIIQSLNDWKIFNTVHVVNNRYEALDYLRQVGKYWDRSKPDIVMADCDLPDHCCEMLLSEIRNDPALYTTPILFITSVNKSAPFETADYMVRFIEKPMSGQKYLGVLMSFENLWITITHLT